MKIVREKNVQIALKRRKNEVLPPEIRFETVLIRRIKFTTGELESKPPLEINMGDFFGNFWENFQKK